MKRNLVYIIIFLVSFFVAFLIGKFLYAAPAPPQNPQVRLVESLPSLTEKQVQTLIEQQTKTVGQHKVITLDAIYADYGDELVNILISVDDYIAPRENITFNGDDHSFFVKANTAYAMSLKSNAGAIMLGIAILDNKKVVNILIVKGIVYIYDVKTHLFSKPKDYTKAGFKFTFVII